MNPVSRKDRKVKTAKIAKKKGIKLTKNNLRALCGNLSVLCY